MNTLTREQEERILAMLRAGKTLRRIENETGHRRETIAAYGRRSGLIGGVVVPFERPRQPVSVCDRFRERIQRALFEGDSLRALHETLVREEAFPASYSALKRYVRTSSLRGRRAEPMMLAA
ncbi:MAG TPA: hypothetical protein VIG32_11900 [Candidatus Baltobacteraceae bacterium]